MTTTILAAIVLSGALSAGAKPAFAAQTDYGQAMRQAAAEGKPMAVLIGKGDVFAKLLSDSVLPEATATLLREKYVCVSVDVNTAAGAQLAGQFQLTDGLVISSAGGTHQALRQSGTVTAADLAKHAAAYANATGTPTTTVNVGTASSASSAPVISSSPPTVYPSSTIPSTPVYPATYPGTSYPAPFYPAGGYSSPFPGSFYPGTRCVGNR
jgi:hypothetical protein